MVPIKLKRLFQMYFVLEKTKRWTSLKGLMIAMGMKYNKANIRSMQRAINTLCALVRCFWRRASVPLVHTDSLY